MIDQNDRLLQEALGYYRSGLYSQALAVCKRVRVKYPDHASALHLMGLCLWQMEQLISAASVLRKAVNLAPADAELQGNLGSIELQLHEYRHAVQHFKLARTLAPDVADYHFNFGVACERLGQTDGAEEAYRAALVQMPDFSPALAELAALLERANRLGEAKAAVGRALKLDPNNETAGIVAAQLELREGRVEQTVGMLRKLLDGSLTPDNRAIVQKRLGMCLDRLGRYDEAFELFSASNRQSARAGDVPGPGWCTFEAIERIRKELPALFGAADTGGHSAPDRMVFLVGFPRSGTTLLDQMLACNSSVRVVEEKTTLRALLTDFMRSSSDLQRLAGADESLLDRYRSAYRKEIMHWVPDLEADRLVVDKLPLNTIFLPLIHRLFPSARFIFAVRDPRDVVLSCFMNSFLMNESMRHFVSLPTAVKYYDAVMSIAVASFPLLKSCVYSQRYEDMIENPRHEQQALCDFLEIDWQEQMLRSHEQASGKRINTPSYHQVTQPLYNRAVGRWRHYRKYLSPGLPVLAPFVSRWRYSVD